MGRTAQTLALVASVLLTGLVGRGAPRDVEGGCPCDSAEAHAPAMSMDDADRSDAGAHDSCPPDCDHCPCCGGAWSYATRSSTMVNGVAVTAVDWLSALRSSAPRGQRTGIFRPPRA